MIKTSINLQSNDNSLFATAQCNNRCLMCAQPPLKQNDIEELFKKNIAIIESAPKELSDIGITGGEPTLLGDIFFTLINKIKTLLPNTQIHILTNGRAFSNISFVKKFINIDYKNILLGIPLHSDYSGDHDFITQVNGAYNETMKGLYNLGEFNFRIELRIVINRINYMRLPQIAKFIYKNLPFVTYISFMGMENTGYAIKNKEKIDIDPTKYQQYLEIAVLDLASWNMNVSIFNLPHCLLTPSLYKFARKSISDWKVKYLDVCNKCICKKKCCGLFKTSKTHSPYINPL